MGPGEPRDSYKSGDFCAWALGPQENEYLRHVTSLCWFVGRKTLRLKLVTSRCINLRFHSAVVFCALSANPASKLAIGELHFEDTVVLRLRLVGTLRLPPALLNNTPSEALGGFSETGRIRFWRARFQTPNSVSFLPFAEFLREKSVSPLSRSRMCKWTRPFWGTDCWRAPKSLFLSRQPPFAGPALRELESACRLSIS